MQSMASSLQQLKVQKQTFHQKNHSKNRKFRYKKSPFERTFYAAFYAGQNQIYIVTN